MNAFVVREGVMYVYLTPQLLHPKEENRGNALKGSLIFLEDFLKELSHKYITELTKGSNANVFVLQIEINVTFTMYSFQKAQNILA